MNQHNCVYWSNEHPHETQEKQLNQPGITVWAAIYSGGIIGPEFFEGTVTGPNYLQKLQTAIFPAMKEMPDFQSLFFMQDGAPPHNANCAQNYLDEVFPNQWIGWWRPVEYPPWSLDLTPMDFSVWGIVKNTVFGRRPENLHDL